MFLFLFSLSLFNTYKSFMRSFSFRLNGSANAFDRLKSKRIYKTLLRSHHKHSSSESHRTESTSNSVIDVRDHPESAITRQSSTAATAAAATVAVIHLQRSSSTPNLKRCWLCQSCNVLNNTVTWHCLNCECVSVVAPIYKDTIQKGCIRANVASGNATTVAPTAALATTAAAAASTVAHSAVTATNATNTDRTNQANNNFNHKNVKCKPKPPNAMNPTFIDYVDRMHRSHRSLDVCPVVVAAQSNSNADDCYVNQIKYNEVTRFQPGAGLCPLNRHHENKSLPNIVDAFHDHESQRKFVPTDDDPSTTAIWSEHFFGERIFTVNKPQPFHATLGKPAAYGSIRNSARNKAITPIHDIQKFTRYATKSAIRESSVVKKMCTPGEACRMCNMGRCNGGGGGGGGNNDSFSIVHNNTKNHHQPSLMENALLDTSRFTVTTLSRSNNPLMKSKDKNQATSSRNGGGGGGVLIAVRDWSPQEKSGGPSGAAIKNGLSMGSAVTPLSPPTPSASSSSAAIGSDSYYEILRNPNNNTAGAAAIVASESNKELLSNRMAKTQAHIYENSATSGKNGESNGPIYAVVNKQNKTKNSKALSGGQAVVAVESLKSPDQTRFTYIGMSKPLKTTTTPTTTSTPTVMNSDAIFASGKHTSNNNNNNNSSSNSSSHTISNNNVMMMPSLTNNVNNNNNNNNNGVSSSSSSSSNDCTPIVTANAEFSTKVWKGQKKPLEPNKM